ncbi:hypothetical protein [Candidatus Viridilinea mediisalina]|nr:hypothetical protein [Candidatus Viridilinea mediisalina]
MDVLATLLRYGFVAALALEAGLIGYALVRLAREKARLSEVLASQE